MKVVIKITSHLFRRPGLPIYAKLIAPPIMAKMILKNLSYFLQVAASMTTQISEQAFLPNPRHSILVEVHSTCAGMAIMVNSQKPTLSIFSKDKKSYSSVRIN